MSEEKPKTEPLNIRIEYCGAWGYYPTYMELAEEIKFTMPTAKVSGFVGRSSSFEIYVGEYLIFSKLGAGFFPDPGDVVTVLKNIEATGKMPEGARKVEVDKLKPTEEEGSCCVQ